MVYQETLQNQVSVPKQIRLYPGIEPGEEIGYCNLPDGSMQMTPSPKVSQKLSINIYLLKLDAKFSSK